MLKFKLRFLGLCLGFFGFAGSGLGEGGQAKMETTTTTTTTTILAKIFALQLFLHCNYFCSLGSFGFA